MTHICVGNLATIDNGLLSGRRQTIIWTSAGILLTGNFNRKSYIFTQENAFESVVWKLGSILHPPQCVKSLSCFWIWTRVGILLTGHLGIEFRVILMNIHTFSFKSIDWKMATILSPPQCVKSLSCCCIWTSRTFDNDTVIDDNYLKMKTSSASNIPNHNTRRPLRVMFSFVHTLTSPYRQNLVLFALRMHTSKCADCISTVAVEHVRYVLIQWSLWEV